jgi:hypothetical protein
VSELCLHRTVVERKGEYLRIERGFETVAGYAACSIVKLNHKGIQVSKSRKMSRNTEHPSDADPDNSTHSSRSSTFPADPLYLNIPPGPNLTHVF